MWQWHLSLTTLALGFLLLVLFFVLIVVACERGLEILEFLGKVLEE